MDIQNPVRWMPNGWGEPHLYDFSAQVICDGKTIASRQHRIGLRTIRVVNEKDKEGESFYFEVNGIPMFAKGANYIPDDALLPCITTERYKTLFRDMKEANMNMVRIWGEELMRMIVSMIWQMKMVFLFGRILCLPVLLIPAILLS